MKATWLSVLLVVVAFGCQGTPIVNDTPLETAALVNEPVVRNRGWRVAATAVRLRLSSV